VPVLGWRERASYYFAVDITSSNIYTLLCLYLHILSLSFSWFLMQQLLRAVVCEAIPYMAILAFEARDFASALEPDLDPCSSSLLY
jgi:hypothetical protein